MINSQVRRGSQSAGPVFQVSKLALACGLCVAAVGATHAQSAAAPAAKQAGETVLETVVVTGIRAGLESSVSLKRNAHGVVDGIVAEDIGKFPDTNLAEAMQRISGVSIDRANGEGSRVTVRGVGPDFNLVLLNGRQMPASSINDSSASDSRAFDFANLASESVSALEVFKTGRASKPTGGIGATINIKTARPFDSNKLVASLGVKMVKDESATHAPDSVKGSAVTPEVSGIYSNVFADGMFGVSLTGSYQRRDSGYNQAGVFNGWHTIPANGGGWGEIAPGSTNVNPPKGNDLYSTPQSIGYSMTGVKRERTNGQLTLQFAPIKDLTATLDHTYSENKLQSKRNDLSAWFGFGPSNNTWTDGPIAAPLIYSEVWKPGKPGDTPAGDVAMGSGLFATKNTNHSTGLNLAWKPTSRLKVELDGHHSTAESMPDSPYGSNSVMGTAVFNRGTTTVDFSNDFPVMSLPGASSDVSKQMGTGSSFRNSYMKSEVDQLQLRNNFTLDERSNLDFGLSLTNVKNRSAFSVNENGSWGGVGKPEDYPDNLFHPQTLSTYFSNINGSSNPALFNTFNTFDFEAVRAIAAKLDPNGKYFAPSTANGYTTDRRTTEKSQALYGQYNAEYDVGVPMGLALGLRYERTQVTSSALVPASTGIEWRSFNEFTITQGAPTFTTLEGKYDYVLPSIDVDFELSANDKLRVSYGHSIGRPGWGAIQGGQTLGSYRVGGGEGAQGDPGLKPLKSKNFDLSFEHYFDKGSYIAAGFFHKSIDNYIGDSRIKGTPFNLHTPVGGAFYNEAIAQGCAATDNPCIRNFIFSRHATAPGVTATGKDAAGNITGTITGQPGDPIAVFDISVPANQRNDHINGVELNAQYAFRSGFGFSANYTYVRSGLKYDNNLLGNQFALQGLSNSGNLVGFYEDQTYSARLAYNWRGEFLSGTHDGREPNPIYVEPYGQLDMNLGYKFNKNLSFQFEVINLTDEIARSHERRTEILQMVTQTGRRFMVGARYSF
ncbi:MAG: TonB-dependent receptor [Paucibacter sp.]|nr:TonB-dependent receptor [Roseateles sp.]